MVLVPMILSRSVFRVAASPPIGPILATATPTAVRRSGGNNQIEQPLRMRSFLEGDMPAVLLS